MLQSSLQRVSVQKTSVCIWKSTGNLVGGGPMAGRKYAADYRIENHVLPDGKVEATRVYQGTWYSYVAEKEEIARLRKMLLGGAVGTLLLLIPMLLDNTRLGRTFYIVLPACFCLVPIYLLLAAVRRLGFADDPFTREHRDKTDRRIRVSCVALTMLLAVSCGGCLVLGVLEGFASNEIFCMVSLLLALGVSIWLLPHRKKAAARKAEA